MRLSPFAVVFVLAAAAGLFFAAFSTHDFVEHLDRQVHSIHCSFIPGLENPDASGSSGCHVTMMSPYSSMFRSALWGGIPISLPAMSVFAFLLFRGVDLMVNRRSDERGPRVFLAAAAGLPVLASLVMGYISMVELGAACKLCIGIYASSAVAFVAALLELRAASQPALPSFGTGYGVPDTAQTDTGDVRDHAMSFGQGVGFVAVPLLVYVIAMPDYSGFIGECGSLSKPEDPYGVMVPLGPQNGATAIEVFDPLCPACKGFEGRLDASGLGEKIARKAVMFPLDTECNWMVGSSLHPGACTVSKAVLCAEAKADTVVDWAFENQEAIRTAATSDPKAAEKMVTAAFPELSSCIGSKVTEQRLNKSLRWAVANQLPVLTPQLYVNGVKLCDEDTDLGMEYALSRLLEKQAGGNAVAGGTP